MFSSPQSLLKRPPFGEGNDESKRQYEGVFKKQHDTDAKTVVTTNSHREIRRNPSSETHSTDYSSYGSGIHSLDLLMEIYPPISESESDHRESKEEYKDNDIDNDTTNAVFQPNYSEGRTTKDSQKEEVANENLSFFSFGNIASYWVEDKPFDEESLRAMSEKMSERGDYRENVFSKDADRLEEYILPPANLPNEFREKSTGETQYDSNKKPSVRIKVPTKHRRLKSEDDNKKASGGEARKKEKYKPFGFSKKSLCIAFILISCLLAAAIFLGIWSSQKFYEINESNQQATAAPSDSTESVEGTNEDSAGGNSIFPSEPDTQFNETIQGNITLIGGEILPDESPSDENIPESGSGQQAQECLSRLSLVHDCSTWTEHVVVVTFENCSPEEGDWVAVYPDDTTFEIENSTKEWAGDDYIYWAFTCGDPTCDTSPSSNSIAFPTDYDTASDSTSFRLYLLRLTANGPPYEVIGKSESFVPAQPCE